MLIVGTDPGLDGAFAFYSTESRRIVAAFSMPILTLERHKSSTRKAGTKREISLSQLVYKIDEALDGMPVTQAFLERVQSSPEQGRASAFNFGDGYGAIKGVIAERRWPLELVTPGKWKKALAVPADKDDAVNRACQLMPADVGFWTVERGLITKAQASGRAEAALLCKYGEIWLSEHGQKTKPKRRILSDILNV